MTIEAAGPLHENALGILPHTFPVIGPPSSGVLYTGNATTILRYEVGTTHIRILSHTTNEVILGAYRDLVAKASKASTVMVEEHGVPRYIRQAISILIKIEEPSLKFGCR